MFMYLNWRWRFAQHRLHSIHHQLWKQPFNSRESRHGFIVLGFEWRSMRVIYVTESLPLGVTTQFFTYTFLGLLFMPLQNTSIPCYCVEPKIDVGQKVGCSSFTANLLIDVFVLWWTTHARPVVVANGESL